MTIQETTDWIATGMAQKMVNSSAKVAKRRRTFHVSGGDREPSNDAKGHSPFNPPADGT